jgi:hypothetical protein
VAISAGEIAGERQPGKAWRSTVIGLLCGSVTLGCGLVWAAEAVLTARHYDGYSLKAEDGANRAALGFLFVVLVPIGPIVALMAYAILRIRLRSIAAAAVILAPTVTWAGVLFHRIASMHCFDFNAVC